MTSFIIEEGTWAIRHLRSHILISFKVFHFNLLKTRTHYFHIDHNAPWLPLRILHNHCFRFLLGITVVPREIENNGYVKLKKMVRKLRTNLDKKFDLFLNGWLRSQTSARKEILGEMNTLAYICH